MDPALTNRYPQRLDAIKGWIIPTRSCNATTGAQTSPQTWSERISQSTPTGEFDDEGGGDSVHRHASPNERKDHPWR